MFYQINSSKKKVLFYDQKSNQQITSSQLTSDIDKSLSSFNEQKKSLCFIFCDQSYSTVLTYLSLLNSKHSIFLGDVNQESELKKKIIDLYKPRWIWSPKELEEMNEYLLLDHFIGYLYTPKEFESYAIHNDLKLILSSSGSTGSPKLIRLSLNNLQANASSIAHYLKLTKSDKAITSLPLHYSFGLSIINSFLEVKAKVILTNESLISRDFWQTFKQQEISFLAGVPFSFDILSQLHFDRMKLPSLKYLVQAGGSLLPNQIKTFAKNAKDKNADFYVMYGQTEATARISYVPPNKLEEKCGSIGIAIPGGKMYLKSEPEESELIYEGPNVMLGYATSIEDLALGDELKGKLDTGDIARKDKDNYFYITGRLKRFLKLFGLRINLDEAELQLNQKLKCTAICFGDDNCLQIRIESNDEVMVEKAIDIVNNTFHLHHSKVKVSLINKIPRSSNGKIQYEKVT
jgi:long-chain acyl-CoA synthetase